MLYSFRFWGLPPMIFFKGWGFAEQRTFLRSGVCQPILHSFRLWGLPPMIFCRAGLGGKPTTIPLQALEFANQHPFCKYPGCQYLPGFKLFGIIFWGWGFRRPADLVKVKICGLPTNISYRLTGYQPILVLLGLRVCHPPTHSF